MLLQETQKLNEMQAIDVEDPFADDSDEEELESNLIYQIMMRRILPC